MAEFSAGWVESADAVEDAVIGGPERSAPTPALNALGLNALGIGAPIRGTPIDPLTLQKAVAGEPSHPPPRPTPHT